MIKQHPRIRVGALANFPPYSYIEEGVFKGFSIDYIRYLADRIGFDIEFVSQDNTQALRESLEQGMVDMASFLSIVCDSFANPLLQYSHNIPFGNLRLITLKGEQLDLQHKSTIGLPFIFKNKVPEIKQKLENVDFLYCTLARCIDALKDGEVDALIHILNKAIDRTDHHIIDDILLNISVGTKYQLTSLELIQKYWLQTFASILSFIFIMLFYYLYTNSREQKLKYQLSEQERKKLQAEQELYESLMYDKLTGLAKLEVFIVNVAKRGARKDAWQGIMCLDIDKFSAINEYYGRALGDELLCEISERLMHLTQQENLSRYGGDEFCIYIEGENQQQVEKWIRSLDQRITQSISIGDAQVNIACRYGVARFNQGDNFDPNIIYHQAALALNRASQSNVFTPVFFDLASQQEISNDLQIINALPDALKNRELCVYYQPQISSETGKVIGVEALVRWEHPILGYIRPDRFIHIAEQHNFIAQLDHYVLEVACKEIVSSFPNGEDALHVSVNISAAELFQEEFVDTFIQTVRYSGLALSRLTIEVTESLMISDEAVTVAILNKLRTYGFGISIDDFGTGYSSLRYINTLPITEIKIDKSFIDNIFHNQQDRELIQSILAIGKISKNKVVAEGVESKEQAQWLKGVQCDYLQGYYYAKPMPIDELIVFLEQG